MKIEATTVERPGDDTSLTTLLFVDIVGSTTLAERLGDPAWRDLLVRFYATVREVLAGFGGREVGTTGDGMLATFEGPAPAVHCGQALHRAVAGLGLEVRVGVHTAEVGRIGGDVAGLGVHVGARVTAMAEPGEVWLTRAARDLSGGSALRFEPRGTHRLRGLSQPWQLYAAA